MGTPRISVLPKGGAPVSATHHVMRNGVLDVFRKIVWIDWLANAIGAIQPLTQVNLLASLTAEWPIRRVFSPGDGDYFLTGWTFKS